MKSCSMSLVRLVLGTPTVAASHNLVFPAVRRVLPSGEPTWFNGLAGASLLTLVVFPMNLLTW